MKINSSTLFVEINNSEFVFTAIRCTDGQSFSVIEKVTAIHNYIKSYKMINIPLVQEEIKKNVKIIENKINYVFEEVIIILDGLKFSCNNVSGSKKLNGSSKTSSSLLPDG